MNRRNFIKMMGAMVVTIPTISAIPAALATTAPRQYNGDIYIDTVDNQTYEFSTFDNKWHMGEQT